MAHSFPYEHLIATTPDFPQKGVLFRDISPLLAQKFPETIDALAEVLFSSPMGCRPGESRDLKTSRDSRLRGNDENLCLDHIDAFAGIDARGFIFASALAQKFGKNMVMIRKGGKLPPPAHQESYALEYGSATLELKPAVPIYDPPLTSPEHSRSKCNGFKIEEYFGRGKKAKAFSRGTVMAI